MAKSNAAEAMPMPEPEKDDDALELTDADLEEMKVDEEKPRPPKVPEGKAAKGKKNKLDMKVEAPKEAAKETSGETKRKKKRAPRKKKVAVDADKELKDLQKKFDIMMDKAMEGREGTPLGNEIKKALMNSPEAKRLRELMEEKEQGFDLESLVNEHYGVQDGMTEAVPAKDFEDMQINEQIDYLHDQLQPDFKADYNKAADLQAAYQKAVETGVRGDGKKLGWWGKRKMKKELAILNEDLSAMHDDIIAARQRMESGAPAPDYSKPILEAGETMSPQEMKKQALNEEMEALSVKIEAEEANPAHKASALKKMRKKMAKLQKKLDRLG